MGQLYLADWGGEDGTPRGGSVREKKDKGTVTIGRDEKKKKTGKWSPEQCKEGTVKKT